MFRSLTIIRELVLNLAKVIFMLQHLVELRCYLLCGCVAAYHGMACVLHAVHLQRMCAVCYMEIANVYTTDLCCLLYGNCK
jgi:hypothetical protein